MTATKPIKNLLLTGAAGMLGRVLTQPLAEVCDRLTLSDLAPALAQLNPPPAHRAVPCDLADAAGVHALLQGIDAVVHLGGVAVEGPFEPILQANIRGLHHLYEAARLDGAGHRVGVRAAGRLCGRRGKRNSSRCGKTRPKRPSRPNYRAFR